ncbi:MAG: hypothetical protein HXS44_01950 [Theionarchaea archaeon]|nr:hypothetical protein [Theionarchaea archaeon]
MKSEQKIGIGSFLAAIGSIGVILSFLVGPPDLGRPWSFLIGFTLGIICGLGATLSIHGLIERRRGK